MYIVVRLVAAGAAAGRRYILSYLMLASTARARGAVVLRVDDPPPPTMAALLAISIAIGPTLAVSQSTARVPACKVTLSNAVSPNSCVAYDLCPTGPSAAAPAAGFQLNDSYPEPYLIAPPFREVDISNCSACPPGSVASGYQFAPGHFCSARCIALGKPAELVATAPLDHRHPSQGVSLTFGGGDGGRKVTSVQRSVQTGGAVGTGGGPAVATTVRCWL